jgi:hypothetical protein
MAEAPTEASALLVPDAPASAEAPAPHDDDADDRANCDCSNAPKHAHHMIVYGRHPHHPFPTEGRDESWEGARTKWSMLVAKAAIATILTVFSVYVTIDGWSEIDYADMGEFKALAFALSLVLTLPQLYQTTLITLAFWALGRGDVSTELQQRRHPLHVLVIGFALILVTPFVLPPLILVALCVNPEHLGVHDHWLIIVGLIDFLQTLVLVPLGYVVVFSAAGPPDVVVNIVAVQVFSDFDDYFVRSFDNPQNIKYENLETYCEKADKSKAKEDGGEAEEVTCSLSCAKEDEDAWDDEEIETWRGAVPSLLPLTAKGILAMVFTVFSAYVTYDTWADVDFDDMLVFKSLMVALAVMLLLPQLYDTTLISLTFFAVARDDIVDELKQRRPVQVVLGLAFGFFLVLPFALPALIVFGPIIKPCLERVGVRDYWMMVVGLIDCTQTIVLFPLAFTMIFAADCPTDIYSASSFSARRPPRTAPRH